MTEPTIDEMLAWLELATVSDSVVLDEQVSLASHEIEITEAIRAILEQHREDTMSEGEKSAWQFKRHVELAAIRAFVERAEARLPEYSTGRGADEWLKNYHRAVQDELEAMEQEAE